ncbi:MAG: hypothetical protein ACRDIC_11940 [bacterium]
MFLQIRGADQRARRLSRYHHHRLDLPLRGSGDRVEEANGLLQRHHPRGGPEEFTCTRPGLLQIAARDRGQRELRETALDGHRYPLPDRAESC